jgi:ABC-type transport system involved in cytochrome c biogenesis permease subunit
VIRVLRNIAIIALLALVVAAVPGGGNAATALVTALVLTFLAVIALAASRIYRQNQFGYLSLSDGWRAAVVVAVGAVVLMIAAADELLGDGLGLVVWLGVLGLSVFTLIRAWGESQSY